MPSMTPARVRSGGNTPRGRVSGSVSAGPKHKIFVHAMGRCAAPMMSRITPPTPVLAPPNGSTALGWLCVSHFNASVRPGVNEMMPALPTNALRTIGELICSVVSRNELMSDFRTLPVVVVMDARNVLCEQCSLQVWAIVSSSTSVGKRPMRTK